MRQPSDKEVIDGVVEVFSELGEERFTGNLTFHFTAGKPRKMRKEEVYDLTKIEE